MIKNIKDLNDAELDVLKELYIRYFDELNDKNTNFFQKAMEKFTGNGSEYYACEMIEKVLNGERIGFILGSYSIHLKPSIVGFITGKVDEDGSGWISHLYIDPKFNPYDSQYKHGSALVLYRTLASEFKELGVTKVFTEASENEREYREILKALKFIPTYDYGGGVEDYGRAI